MKELPAKFNKQGLRFKVIMRKEKVLGPSLNCGSKYLWIRLILDHLRLLHTRALTHTHAPKIRHDENWNSEE